MRSLLKWAGGKNWLLDRFSHTLPDPSTITGYREPFVGSGAVAKHFLGKVECHLSDATRRTLAVRMAMSPPQDDRPTTPTGPPAFDPEHAEGHQSTHPGPPPDLEWEPETGRQCIPPPAPWSHR